MDILLYYPENSSNAKIFLNILAPKNDLSIAPRKLIRQCRSLVCI